uniref:NUC153 domain-containing protein n=1 Tax=Parascaris univalens TaxID=6257 RepID=A0A915BUV8_PARUN
MCMYAASEACEWELASNMKRKSLKKMRKKKLSMVQSDGEQSKGVASMPTESGEDARGERSLLKRKKNRTFHRDDRFESVLSDPRFDSMARKDRKVVIDKRFKSMLTNEKFGTKCAVDMRGRRINIGMANTLGELYDLDDSANEEGDSDVGTGENDREIRIDLARGDGNITSSGEDSGSEWSFDDEGNTVEHKWGELDRGATHIESATRRLALCNMEWDRISASDIFIVLSSFKPSSPAAILSVTIYLSDFGKERLEEEEQLGPRIPQMSDCIDDVDELDKNTREALRAYQLDRMRYYYAIIECDHAQTAAAIYDQCDGVEFESSSVRMDLRFVPDGTTFEENVVKERVNEKDVDVNAFKPKFFESAALSKSATKLTWDETDPDRIKAQRDAFLPNADLEQLEHLIAHASSDEEGRGDNDTIYMLKAEPNRKDEEEGDVKVSSSKDENNDRQTQMNKEEPSEPTPWQKYLQRRKQKRKERKALMAELKKRRKAESDQAPVASSELTRHERKPSPAKQQQQVDDERFAALYTNSAFAIDQSNPLYKPSELIAKQVAEKKRKMHDNTEEGIASLASKLRKKTEILVEKKKTRECGHCLPAVFSQ